MEGIKKATKILLLCSVAILFAILLVPKEYSAEGTTTYLDEMEPIEKGGNFFKNQWYYQWKYQAFEDLDGNLIDRGISFYTSSSYAAPFAVYNIKGMNYSSFETQVSIDKKWIEGDLGKTAVAIFADDHLLLERQVSLKSGVMNIHLNLPTGASKLKIVVRQLIGAKGVYGIIFGNSRLLTGSSQTILEDEMSLNTLGAYKSTAYINKDYWASQPFQDKNENIVTTGIGLYGDNSATAQYQIDQFDYNVFETKLSLDPNWTKGDYGKTAVGIYADDYKLYEKQLTKDTPIQSIKLRIPKGTKTLSLITKSIAGAQGTHRVIFINPVLKKTKDAPLIVTRNSSVTTVGAYETSGYYGQNLWSYWLATKPTFQYINGDLVTSGVGFNGDGSYAAFNISEMNFNTFTANLSLDSKWVIGDYGKSAIFFYANNKQIYSQAVTKVTGVKPLFLRLPSNTTSFKVLIKQTNGALGTHGVVLGNAQFRYYSYTPSLKTTQLKAINNTGKKDVVTISKVLQGDIIKIYNSAGKLLASPKATGSTVTVYLPQIGTKSGKLYIAAKRGTYLDSAKTGVTFGGEKTSTSKLKRVTIKNYKNRYDTIFVSNLQKYDMIYVYNTRGTVIATKQASSSMATIYIKQLGKKKSYIYLAARGSGMTISSKVKMSFKSE